jgi:hypothetical protein
MPRIEERFFGLANRLSPENLCCDGELSRSQTRIRYQQIMREWRALEKEVGRKFTLTEIENAQIEEYMSRNRKVVV